MSEKIGMENLLPAPGSGLWRTETPEHKQIASFCAGEADGSLGIHLNSDAYGLGKWVTEIPVSPGWYDFSADCRTSVGDHEVYVLLTVLRADGTMIFREHAQNAQKTPYGWRFSDNTEVPEDGVRIRVELWLRGYRAYALWQNPTLTRGEKPQSRKVTVALGYMLTTPPATIEHNLAKMMGIVDQCGAANGGARLDASSFGACGDGGRQNRFGHAGESGSVSHLSAVQFL